jgi:hypothetical protein
VDSRQVIQLLRDVAHRHRISHRVGEVPAEAGLQLRAHDEHDGAETGAHGVIDAVVQQGFSARPHRLQLLHATVAIRQAGGQDHEDGLHDVTWWRTGHHGPM